MRGWLNCFLQARQGHLRILVKNWIGLLQRTWIIFWHWHFCIWRNPARASCTRPVTFLSRCDTCPEASWLPCLPLSFQVFVSFRAFVPQLRSTVILVYDQSFSNLVCSMGFGFSNGTPSKLISSLSLNSFIEFSFRNGHLRFSPLNNDQCLLGFLPSQKAQCSTYQSCGLPERHLTFFSESEPSGVASALCHLSKT